MNIKIRSGKIPNQLVIIHRLNQFCFTVLNILGRLFLLTKLYVDYKF